MKIIEIQKYRDSQGFIDFDEISEKENFNSLEPKREVRGTQSREKMWLHFDDATVLLKTVEKETNLVGTCYAELISAELAKQAGFKAAKVDLIKYNGYSGIISEKVNKDGEQLHSLREYIGDEELLNDPAPEITGLDFTIRGLANYLKEKSDMTKEEKYSLLRQIMKLMVFDAFTLGTDRHTENISFIERMKDNKKEIILSPLYDNEFSLMLETREEDLKDYLQDSKLFYSFVDAQEPKIAPKYEGMEKELPSHYKNLVEALVDMDEEVEDFTVELINKLDIVASIKAVEQHIGSSIPSVYRDTAIYSFERRKREISQLLSLEIEFEEENREI